MPGYVTTPEDYYPQQSTEWICNQPVDVLALADSILFLWATSPLLPDALQVIDAWGFVYKAMFVWDKIKHNMGHYNSVRHELLLIAVRGSCLPDEPKLFDSVVEIERQRHSEKPEFFREVIDTLYPLGPRIELFARQACPGWAAWGNQVKRGAL